MSPMETLQDISRTLALHVFCGVVVRTLLLPLVVPWAVV
jgi:hypothetical protein